MHTRTVSGSSTTMYSYVLYTIIYFILVCGVLRYPLQNIYWKGVIPRSGSVTTTYAQPVSSSIHGNVITPGVYSCNARNASNKHNIGTRLVNTHGHDTSICMYTVCSVILFVYVHGGGYVTYIGKVITSSIALTTQPPGRCTV